MKLQMNLLICMLLALVASGTACITFTCSHGTVHSNSSYQSKPNGCGTAIIANTVKPFVYTILQPCCNRHDTCYGTCLSDKTQCDQNFLQCLKKTCNDNYGFTVLSKADPKSLAGCLMEANAGYSLVTKLGCQAFESSQSGACMCSP